MSNSKFYYDPNTLSFEKVRKTWWQIVLRIFGFISATLITSAIVIWAFLSFFPSPNEKRLNEELETMKLQYALLSKELDDMNIVLDEIADRDDNIYRVIFAADPIPSEIRSMGIGGSAGNRYRQFDHLETKDLLIHLTEKTKLVQRRLVQQSKSYDEVAELAKQKNELIATIPAIQPVANKDLKRISSGFGWRVDPHYKTKKFHAGLDFSAPIGTPIYATGDGVIEKAIQRKYRTTLGLGNYVKIKHGFGYQTIYGHMSKVIVRTGQKVKRGQIIGYVGNSGKSTAAHLHYEVVRNGKKVNPVDFFYNDLTPEQYAKVIEMASKGNQPFD